MTKGIFADFLANVKGLLRGERGVPKLSLPRCCICGEDATHNPSHEAWYCGPCFPPFLRRLAGDPR